MERNIRRIFSWFIKLTFLLVAFFAVYFYISDNSIKGDYYYRMAKSLEDRNTSATYEVVKYYKKAIASYKGANDVEGAVDSYINLALLHYSLGNYLQVEQSVLSAMEFGEEKIPDEAKVKVYLLLASTQEPQKSKEYIKKSLEISERNGFNILTAQAYFLLGKTNEYKAEFEDAERNYLKAVNVVKNFANISTEFNAGELYERLGELYAGGGQIDKAIEFYKEALSYNLEGERGFVTANYMKILGDLYKEKRDMAMACHMWIESKKEYAFFGAEAPFSVSNINSSGYCINLG